MPPDLGVKLRKLPETLLQSLGGNLFRFAPFGAFQDVWCTLPLARRPRSRSVRGLSGSF